ncbi:MAG: multicopper oxidase family protein [Anaerolineae bacterium]|nr:multicopper oxidase family protein [Anaerolineae bacterium]
MSRIVSRRKFLRGAQVGAAFALGGSLGAFAPGSRPLLATAGERLGPAAVPSAPAVAPQMDMGPFVPDAEISLSATEKWVQILPGSQTRVWGYEGQLLSGSGATVEAIPGSYLGPIIRVQSGTKLRLHLHNNLPEETVLHPHGLRVPEDADGQPMQAFGPGETKVYEFQVIDPACPAWFHPHPHMRTAYQVAMGLAGLFYVTDPVEAAAVPGAGTGANDIPLVIQDRTFDASNQFLYQPHHLWGYLGDRILVNGQPDASLSLEPRAYRLRVLNGSNARTFKLAWSNGMPLQVIGTDGGLLPAVAQRSYVTLMPGERADLWADFTALARKQVVLQSQSFDPGGGMMGGGGGGGGGMGGGGRHGGGGGGMGGDGMGSALPNGAAFNILTVNVGRKATTKPVLGPLPALPVRWDASNVANFSQPVPFTLDMYMMTWYINGRLYEMMAVAEDEMVYKDVPIAWEWINNGPIPHPMHIHNVQFQVVGRTPTSALSSYATVNQGFVDSGWKDTVTVWPGERVKIAMNFGPHTGMYMYHCHILEHEDMGMMRNLMIMDPTMPGM